VFELQISAPQHVYINLFFTPYILHMTVVFTDTITVSQAENKLSNQIGYIQRRTDRFIKLFHSQVSVTVNTSEEINMDTIYTS